MREKSVRRSILAYLKTRPDCYVTPIVAGPYGQRGAPDLVVCAGGWFLAIETKAPGGVQTPIQKAVQRQIENAGGTYLLADNVNVARTWFEERRKT